MTKRSDMASRYAAAHARREQRRSQGATREYLPLAEHESQGPATAAASTVQTSVRGTAAAAAVRLPSMDYSYLRRDLLRTATLAIILFALMIILSLVIHV